MPENPVYHIRLDEPTIARGYTVAAFDDALKLSLVPGILSSTTEVEVMRLNEPMDMPWQLEAISDIYQFEFKNKVAYDNHKPFYIQFAYDGDDNNYKQVYFFDKNYNGWRPLPTRDFPADHFVRSLIHLPFARIAVFSYPEVLTVGQASWYAYKGGLFAASPDFPKGSRLRVTNPENGKFVDVEINDFGPDRGLFPARVIDLDKPAFARIAPLGAGVADIEVEPLYIPPDADGRVLGVAADGVNSRVEVGLKSAVIFEEKDGRVLWEKDATSTRPLASLTKLVAVKVFLDTKPSLDTVVAYSTSDEEYNYEYCKPWESAKLSLKDGETLTVENLLYTSLVGSTNNTIETLVRASGLPRDEFIKRMNEAVTAWGASSTKFVEPTGLAPENVSSALDYAIITKEVLSHPIIQKASTMPEYRFATINTERSFRIKNTDQIIKMDKYIVTGSKTGYLDEAGFCLMVRIKAPDGNNLTVVTMGADTRDDSFAETEELIRYGLKIYE